MDALTALFDEAEAKAASRAAAEAGDDEVVARPSARERGVPTPSLAVLLPTRDAASGMKRHEPIGLNPNSNSNPIPNLNPNPNPNQP